MQMHPYPGLLGALLVCASTLAAPASPPNTTVITPPRVPGGMNGKAPPTSGKANSSTPADKHQEEEDLPVWAHKLMLSSKRSGSVSIWLGVCSDLCRAGLGGTPCGPTCVAATPDTMTMGVRVPGVKSRPREEVCPILCRNNLGYPLCGCTIKYILAGTPDWSGICQEFCRTQHMTLTGCSACTITPSRNNTGNHTVIAGKPGVENIFTEPVGRSLAPQKNPVNSTAMQAMGYRKLGNANPLGHLSDKTIHFNDADIGGPEVGNWSEWCNLVCKAGDGGAACNCDLAPFY